MNLFFRLLRIYFSAVRHTKTTHYNDVHTLRFSVFITDQDVFNHLNNSRYLSFTDLAMVDWLIRVGAWRIIRGQGWFPVFVYKEQHYYKQLRFPQAFDVETRLVGWEDGYLCCEHHFMRNGTCYALSRTIGRIIGRKGQRPTVDEIADLLGVDKKDQPTLPDVFVDRLDKIKAGAPTFSDPSSNLETVT